MTLASRPAALGLVAGVGCANLALAVALVERSPALALAVGLLPAAAVAFAALAASRNPALLLMAFGLPLSLPLLNRSIPVGAGSNLFVADVVVVLALGTWIVQRLVLGNDAPRWPRTPVLGWPFVLFAVAIVAATLRGHAAYGSSLVGQPLRLVLYAGIGGAIAGVTPRQLYRLLIAVFYGGTVWMLMNAAYYIASGTSQTNQDVLSTGGTRILGISTSMYMGGAAILALLSLRLEQRASLRALHATMALCGAVGVVLGFGRAVFASAALVSVVILVLSGRIRRQLLSIVPFLVPALVVAALLVPRAAPDLVPSFAGRVTSSPSRDLNVQWRVKANAAVLEQVRESPWIGVGFGRTASFSLDVESSSGFRVPTRIDIYQDPHNGYLFLLAGGGVFALGAFLLVLATYAVDCIRRYRATSDEIGRLIVAWSGATLFVFLFNAASGTMFESAADLLTIWALLLIPAVVSAGAAVPALERSQGTRSAEVVGR